jgi:hypothetical protein
MKRQKKTYETTATTNSTAYKRRLRANRRGILLRYYSGSISFISITIRSRQFRKSDILSSGAIVPLHVRRRDSSITEEKIWHYPLLDLPPHPCDELSRRDNNCSLCSKPDRKTGSKGDVENVKPNTSHLPTPFVHSIRFRRIRIASAGFDYCENGSRHGRHSPRLPSLRVPHHSHLWRSRSDRESKVPLFHRVAVRMVWRIDRAGGLPQLPSPEVTGSSQGITSEAPLTG